MEATVRLARFTDQKPPCVFTCSLRAILAVANNLTLEIENAQCFIFMISNKTSNQKHDIRYFNNDGQNIHKTKKKNNISPRYNNSLKYSKCHNSGFKSNHLKYTYLVPTKKQNRDLFIHSNKRAWCCQANLSLIARETTAFVALTFY